MDIRAKRAAEYAPCAVSAFAAGLAAYLFVFTNKLLNLDEIAGLFGKGESVSSGRWALALTSLVFPDLSMPWINGVLSLVMLTAAACLTARVFEIKNRLWQVLLGALLIVFPSQIVTFSYMFTCAPYALAVLLAAGSAYVLLCREGRRRYAPACAMLALSLGIYQAYLSIAASWCVVYLLKRTLDGEWSARRIVRCGVSCAAYLALSLAAYFAINKIVMLAAHTEYNSYADASFQTDISSMLFGLRVAYTAFLGYFYRGYYHLVASDTSRLMHYVCLAVVMGELALWFIKDRPDRARGALAAALLALLPLSVNCLYVISAQRHTLMLYSFTAVYILAAVAAESLTVRRHRAARDALALALAVIVGCNVLYANRLYLKMKLEYENAYAFYSGLTARVKAAPGYGAGTMVLLTGDAHELLHSADEIDTSDLVGIMEGLINVYSRSDFLTYYAGFDPPTFDWARWDASGAATEIEDMPIYPYDGSVRCIGDFVVVKLG